MKMFLPGQSPASARLLTVWSIYAVMVLVVTSAEVAELEETFPVVDDASDKCLACMCAGSDPVGTCNFDTGCDKDGRCGPYRMAEIHWIMGGMNGGEDYQACAKSPECAAKTIRGYQKRLPIDCNEDGVLDCLDLVLLYELGWDHCRVPNSQFQTTPALYDYVRTCLAAEQH